MVVDDFTTEIDGVTSAAGMVSTTWSESTGSSVPVGVPCAVAMSVSSSWSRSAWVTVYVAVQTVVAPGARVVCGQVIGPRFAFDDGGVLYVGDVDVVQGDAAGVGDQEAVGHLLARPS